MATPQRHGSPNDSDGGITNTLLLDRNVRFTAIHAVGIPSDAALLVKNLRFLDLDLLPDWPEINDRTFRAVKDAHLTQKERVRCAEWVLFKLFDLWDPVDTRNRLNAYFPALEPRQSIKLRAALNQCLNELKFAGVLGRECVIRKSTLDECKGAKFEELLFVLSTVVLRKRFNDRTDESNVVTVAQQLSLGNNLDNKDAPCLEPLILTHKKSLDRSLEARLEFSRRAGTLEGSFQDTLVDLDAKTTKTEVDLNRYEKAFGESDISIDKMKSQLRNECAYSDKWLNLVISGDPCQDRNPLIEDSFSSIWTRSINNIPLNYSAYPNSLLADLECRIKEQNLRLSRWRDFQKTVSMRSEDLILESPSKSQKSPRKIALGPRSASKSPKKPPRAQYVRAQSDTIASTPKYTFKGLRDKAPVSLAAPSPSRSPTRISNSIDGQGDFRPLQHPPPFTPTPHDLPAPRPIDDAITTPPILPINFNITPRSNANSSITQTPPGETELSETNTSTSFPSTPSKNPPSTTTDDIPPTIPNSAHHNPAISLTERTLATLSRSPHKANRSGDTIASDKPPSTPKHAESNPLETGDRDTVFQSRSRLRMS